MGDNPSAICRAQVWPCWHRRPLCRAPVAVRAAADVGSEPEIIIKLCGADYRFVISGVNYNFVMFGKAHGDARTCPKACPSDVGITDRRSAITVYALKTPGWPTGLEPATTRTTIWGSTIELRPPSLPENKTKIRISFCKQRTRLSSLFPVILAAGGTKISPQLVCHRASPSCEANRCGFDRTVLLHRGFGLSSGTGRRSKRNFSESLSLCATGRKT